MNTIRILTPLLALALLGCQEAPALDGEAPLAPSAGIQARAVALSLTLDTLATPGGVASYTATGANAGEAVHFVRAFGTGTGPCPTALGGGCLDLDAGSTVLLGSTVADTSGEATWDLPIPASAPVGATLVVQAVAVRGLGGVDSVKSPAVDTTLVSSTDLDGDGFDSTVDCDDSDATVHPGAQEICDGIDNDCDPATTEDGVVSHSGVAYASIGDAISYLPPGGQIDLCPGTYRENVVVDRDVHILGVDGAAATVIDGGGAPAPVITVADADLTLEGVTITGGGDSGILLEQNANVDVLSCVITGNTATEGGGIHALSLGSGTCDIFMTDSEVSHNTATFKGGALNVNDGFTHILNSSFVENTALSGGGAIHLSGVSDGAEIDDSVFHGNDGGAGHGGALSIWESAGPVYIWNGDFGVGATENLPSDVYMDDNQGAHVDIAWLQAGETFMCDTATNTCQ